MPLIIASETFDDESQNAVAQNVQPPNLAIEPFMFCERTETEEQAGVSDDLVQLRRMQRNACHHVRRRELHGPRQRAHLAIATTVEEAAEPIADQCVFVRAVRG